MTNEVALRRGIARWSIRSAILVVIVRTALEDKTLRAELPGYDEYARRVRYRLVPGIW